MYNDNRNSVKYGVVTLVEKDDYDYPTARVAYQGKNAKVHMQYPYGFAANMPQGSAVVLASIQDYEQSLVGWGNHPQKRFKNLKEGEVKVGNPLKNSYLYYKDDGSIELHANGDLIITVNNDNNITISGEYTLTCNTINLKGNVIMDSAVVKGNIEVQGNLAVTGTAALGPGGAKIARVGDEVQVGGSLGTIVSGGNNTSL